MADVRPFRALRYAPDLDLAAAVCPPFDTISPGQQRTLHERSPYNAVRIELAEDTGGERYHRAAATLQQWRQDGTLRRDEAPGFYLYRQRFQHGGRAYTRTLLFARLRLEPWEHGAVLPHEQTFGGPKKDRGKLLRATHLNASPVFLFYRDADHEVAGLLAQAAEARPDADFAGDDGGQHTLTRIHAEETVAALAARFAGRTLYVADGHHRYETALAYRDEVRSQAAGWTGEEPENFALVALAAADDPGLLVLPIHRVAAAGAPLPEALSRLRGLFQIEDWEGGAEKLTKALAAHGAGAFGLAAAEPPHLMLLSVRDAGGIDRLLPQERSPAWRRLDYAIANLVILRHCLGLSEAQMSDYSTLWFTEDAGEAVEAVRGGGARYAVILNPVSVGTVLDVADSGERMPQKSTFFYPKVPTGLVFNLLED
ncbi:MAG: DUF1015 domain-containing protein [Sulfuricaulis sp.]|nr:DUF1015 domain-containing protein [Sulfuricaulis sp.]